MNVCEHLSHLNLNLKNCIEFNIYKRIILLHLIFCEGKLKLKTKTKIICLW